MNMTYLKKCKNRFKNGKAGIAVLLLLGNFLCMKGQEAKNFTPSGSPIIVLFSDYTAGLGKANDVSGFNLTRSRFGYQYQAAKSLKATVVLDVNSFENARTVNFHYAMLEWTHENLTLGGGLIALSQFGEQEAFWGRRYIEKSFQDLNGFGFDSDLGMIAKYRFTDWLEADFAITNGEGTMNLNNNNTNKYGFGVTIKPVTGLTVRAYTDIYSDSPDLYLELAPNETVVYKNQSTAAVFAGYRNDFFSLGAEYNYQKSRNFIDECNYSGYSVYAGVPLGEKFELFGRYDYVDTETPAGLTYNWESVANENTLIAGFEYHPVKQLYISPNYRYVKPIVSDAFHSVGINVGFSW